MAITLVEDPTFITLELYLLVLPACESVRIVKKWAWKPTPTSPDQRPAILRVSLIPIHRNQFFNGSVRTTSTKEPRKDNFTLQAVAVSRRHSWLRGRDSLDPLALRLLERRDESPNS